MPTHTNLIELGRTLAVDTDHQLLTLAHNTVLLINLRPQDYPSEVHSGAELIIALHGSFELQTADEQLTVAAGTMVTIEPGIAHWFGPASDAVVLVVFS